jgi:hypothetical protein
MSKTHKHQGIIAKSAGQVLRQVVDSADVQSFGDAHRYRSQIRCINQCWWQTLPPTGSNFETFVRDLRWH